MSNLVQLQSQDWPEPIVRVQSLSQSGSFVLPPTYIKPPSERPCHNSLQTNEVGDIPLIDLSGFDDEALRGGIFDAVGKACKEWGFFQVVNHGVSPRLMRAVKAAWREFFHSPQEVKEEYANSPNTYEGYGSRLGVKKGAVLDWSDYFFLHYRPHSLKDHKKWPANPSSCREETEEYNKEVVNLCGKIMKMLSVTLGLGEKYLQDCFGGEDIGACLRVNYYPKCPQPDLTLGISPHSDPGGITVLLPDDNVSGLQVRKGDSWVTVKPVSDAFIVNIGDQVQILSNGIYRSVEHRVIVNSGKERFSLAFFYNPRSDLLIQPSKLLVTPERPAMYQPMTFDEYRLYIRTRGPQGKAQMDSLKSTSNSTPPCNTMS
ncbi:hypothetical protein Syun_000263 [Stephania yunnanensis]|uniref:Fe2OG dioxygenase domain-containing protein n=1 Tax=Stephania yunnanensis TaxID=152371 RepID=A0AAP0LCV3_9MAGN